VLGLLAWPGAAAAASSGCGRPARLDDGWIGSLDAPVFSFFPEYADLRTPEKGRITLRDLLTMTSGLAWPEGAVPYSDPANVNRRRYAAPDPDRFVSRPPLRRRCRSSRRARPGATYRRSCRPSAPSSRSTRSM
jgi:CubicO group peptidase (beta-lactamase class C family)